MDCRLRGNDECVQFTTTSAAMTSVCHNLPLKVDFGLTEYY